MKKVAIVGVGLMGGSLGMALRRRGWRVTGVGRRLSKLKKAKARGAVDEYTTDLKKGVQGAGIVVLAAPVGNIVPLAAKIRPWLARGALVMDIGSVKAPIVRPLEKIFSGKAGPHFMGVHPMAGSEKTGVEHARADLYRGAACIMTPGRTTPARALRAAETFWRGVGGRTVRLSPEDHDRSVALVSHLPHLLADTLMLAAAKWTRGNLGLVKTLAAGSFRDMTRVAGADDAQWAAIFRMNEKNLADAARLFQKILKDLMRRRWLPADLHKAQKLHREIFKI